MSEKYWLVVQYPLKSAQGSKRDHWLKEKVMEYLETVLTQADLGRSMDVIWVAVWLIQRNM
ncbi:hypothetical protein MT997_04195 [Paenibacillus sp. OVF10]|nr:hypothetical protein MT997_04195 [Paenibacillus sp. OVF10]